MVCMQASARELFLASNQGLGRLAAKSVLPACEIGTLACLFGEPEEYVPGKFLSVG